MNKIDQLIELAAAESGVTPARLMGQQRQSDVKEVRAAIAWTLYQQEGLTGFEIGQLLRRRRTSAYYLVRKAEGMMDNPEFRKLCDALAKLYHE